jgi:hypothetical protein
MTDEYPGRATWKKSSFSNGNGGNNCVEVTFRKSTFSTEHGVNCVEVAHHPDGQILVRDSKDPDGPTLTFTPAEWDAFTKGAAAGEFRF